VVAGISDLRRSIGPSQWHDGHYLSLMLRWSQSPARFLKSLHAGPSERSAQGFFVVRRSKYLDLLKRSRKTGRFVHLKIRIVDFARVARRGKKLAGMCRQQPR